MRQEMRDGFDRVDQRFERVDQRFDLMDQRFDLLNQRFDSLQRTLIVALAALATGSPPGQEPGMLVVKVARS